MHVSQSCLFTASSTRVPSCHSNVACLVLSSFDSGDPYFQCFHADIAHMHQSLTCSVGYCRQTSGTGEWRNFCWTKPSLLLTCAADPSHSV